MRLKETKQVKLFKFTDDKYAQINIYVEPTEPGQGRLIISTQYHIFERFFDGCHPDIFTFLSKQCVESICSCFKESDDLFEKSDRLTNYDFLLSRLEKVWPLFIQALKDEIQMDNPDPNIIQLTINIEHLEADKYNSSTIFPTHAKANMVVNQLLAFADVLEGKILETVKNMPLPIESMEEGFTAVRNWTMKDLI